MLATQISTRPSTSRSPALPARPGGACHAALPPARAHRARHETRIGPSLPHHLTETPARLPAACAKATSPAKEVSDMTRLAERLGYLGQRYVAWRDPRPFKR